MDFPAVIYVSKVAGAYVFVDDPLTLPADSVVAVYSFSEQVQVKVEVVLQTVGETPVEAPVVPPLP